MDSYYAYAPMPLYVILAIGATFYSIVSARRPLTEPSGGSIVLLFLSWLPLLLYNITLLFGAEPGSFDNPYQRASGDILQVCIGFAYILHLFGGSFSILWLFLSVPEKEKPEKDREQKS